jgi:WD40 repeat protein
VADFSLLQLDPDTFEPVGPPIVESLFPISEIAGDGRGELVAVTGLDGVTHVFDTATGSQLGREISGNRNPNASFAADGTTLLVQSDDQVSVWNYDRTSWPAIACTLAGRNLTREEWEEWGPRTIEYRPTCPQFAADDAA